LGGAACQSNTKSDTKVELNLPTNESLNQVSNEPAAAVDVKANVNATVNVPAPVLNTNVDSKIKNDTSISSEPVTKTFNLTLKRFSFSPDNIVVNVGDQVVVNATAEDTTHGFSIAELGVNLVIPQGETKTTTFIASKAGTYTFRCSVYCGAGHTDMTGTLIVK
jgi:heme/copper-type cytochrome/quinol oxidase subunit 2